MLTKLKQLNSSAKSLVDEKFRQGNDKIENIDQYVEPIEEEISIDEFIEAVEKTMQEFEEGDTDMDAHLAKRIHKALDMDKNVASNPGVWNYLSLKIKPEFVRYRWTKCKMERFWASKNLTRHAFAILWWTAEMTSEHGDYSATEKAFNKQDLALQIIDNSFNHVPGLARIFAEEFGEEDGDAIKACAKELNSRLSTRIPEAMSEEDLRSLVQNVKQDYKSS